jgi:non-homologous end joining protein Ku
MGKAPASTRAYERATFGFGLVNIPVDVFTGTVSTHGIKRAMFTEAPVLDDNGQPLTNDEGQPLTVAHSVGYGNVDKETGQLIPPGQPVVKKIATEYGHVFVDDHELEGLFEISPKSIVVREFQPRSLFLTAYVPKALYFIEASKTTQGKRKVENKAAQTSLALVLAAMERKDALAVVDFTTRGVPKPAVLLPDGTLWVVYHTDELREQRALPEVTLDDTVIAQGETLLDMLWGTEPLDLTDQRTALIQEFADNKAKAGDFGQSEAPEEPQVAEPQVADLVALLAASVEQAKVTRKSA